jgi:hypothetical protein
MHCQLRCMVVVVLCTQAHCHMQSSCNVTSNAMVHLPSLSADYSCYCCYCHYCYCRHSHKIQVLGRAIAEERDDDDDDNMLFGRSLLTTSSSTTGIAANTNTSTSGASVAGQRSPPRPGFVKIGSIKRQPSSGR